MIQQAALHYFDFYCQYIQNYVMYLICLFIVWLIFRVFEVLLQVGRTLLVAVVLEDVMFSYHIPPTLYLASAHDHLT